MFEPATGQPVLTKLGRHLHTYHPRYIPRHARYIGFKPGTLLGHVPGLSKTRHIVWSPSNHHVPCLALPGPAIARLRSCSEPFSSYTFRSSCINEDLRSCDATKSILIQNNFRTSVENRLLTTVNDCSLG